MLPKPPAEVPVCRDTSKLAPLFAQKLTLVVAAVPNAIIFETFRTPERQTFLYGFGRSYDDGRGIVTRSATSLASWHGYGLAADLIHRTLEWDAPDSFWKELADAAVKVGLHAGYNWHNQDKPHIQWSADGMRESPSLLDDRDAHTYGIEAVQRKYKAAL